MNRLRLLGAVMMGLGAVVLVFAAIGTLTGGDDATTAGSSSTTSAGSTTSSPTTSTTLGSTSTTTPAASSTTRATTTTAAPTTTTTLAPLGPADAVAFLEEFAAAIDRGDVDFLFDRLHSVVLRTFDPDGTAHDKRLIVIDDGGTLWIQSGHWFRGWYYRLVRNPQVELIWKGEVRPYRAVPIDTSESEGRLRELIKKRVGSVRFYAIRTLLLFADIKPVRLDPVDAEPGARAN